MAAMILALVFAGLISAVESGFVQKPENIAVLKGNTATFTCQVDPADDVTWSRSTKSSPASSDTIYANGQMNPNFRSDYSVTKDASTGTYMLSIQNVITNDGGNFFCSIIFTPSAYAQLIVLDSDPACSVSPSVNAIVEGMALSIVCETLVYPGIDWYPEMIWSLSDGTPLTITDSSSGDMVKTEYTDTVTRAFEGLIIQVLTKFPALDPNAVPSGWDHAMNVPPYSSSFTSGPLHVLYPVSTITFVPERSGYAPGQSIVCESDGQPNTTKTWSNFNETVTGDTLQITTSMLGQNNWTCEASHIIQSTSYSARRSLVFEVGFGLGSAWIQKSEMLVLLMSFLLCVTLKA